MPRPAIPYELYGVLKQQRAIGRRGTDRERRLLYQAYLDSRAAQRRGQRQLDLQQTAIANEERYRAAMLRQQKRQEERNKRASTISGVASIGIMGAMGAKALKGTALGAKLGLGSTTTTTPATAAGPAVSAPAATGGGAAPTVTGGTGAGAAAPATAGGTETTAGATAGSTGAAGTAMGVAGTAAVGYAGGYYGSRIPIGKGKKAGRMKGAATGAAAGAGFGTFVAPGVGTAAGAVIGGVMGYFGAKSSEGGGGCIIVSAATDPASEEVQIARAYRDRFLSRQTLRGYYIIAEKIVPLMIKHEWFKKIVKKCLVDKLVEYGREKLGLGGKAPLVSRIITKLFLSLCNVTGKTVPVFVRSNGEVW